MSRAVQIVQERLIDVEALSPQARDELGNQLAELVLESFVGAPKELIIPNVIFRGPGVRLSTFHDASGAIVGFQSTLIERYRVHGHDYAVYDAGVYARRGVRGSGKLQSRSLLTHAARIKLRHPRTRLCCVSPATTSAGYSLAKRNFPFLHPRPGVTPPPEIDALVREVIRKRVYVCAENDPWIVTVPGVQIRLREPERLSDSQQLAKDPAARYFEERNPGHAEGHWLLTYLPMGFRDLVVAVIPPLARRMNR